LRKLCEACLVLAVALGCDPQSNADLQTYLTPAPSPLFPESPYTLSGTVTESGTARPLPNVLVETSGRTTMTNENGFYEFHGQGRSELWFNSDGFERPGPFFVGMSRPTAFNTSLHRVIRSTAGPLSAVLFRDDPFFHMTGNFLEDWVCGRPCKLIRVSVPSNGRLRARVTWPPADREFHLYITQVPSAASLIKFAAGSTGVLTAERPVVGGTDALVYFGLVDDEVIDPQRPGDLPADVPFTLTTSIEP
jgi:hypothetical protein